MSSNTRLEEGMTNGCGCQSCSGDDSNIFTQILNNNETQTTGSITTPSAALDPTNNADDILSGFSQGAGDGSPITITYKFHDSYQSYWSLDGGFQYDQNSITAFTADQQSATRAILNDIERFTNITFVEVGGDTNPDMGFSNALASSGSTTLGGSAYYPTGWDGAGDIFINTNFWGYDGAATDGSYNKFILMHEIGHALGLEHTFTAGLTGEENSEKYSVMAYDTTPWGSFVTAESFQLYDIYSLQQLYGVNTTDSNGDDTYILRAGDAYTIWDSGGNDTMDGQHITSNMTINLEDGTFTTVAVIENIAIAYGTDIENAIGGKANDTIYGNEWDNVIETRNGDDLIYASFGNDSINGEDGNDRVIYDAAINEFSFNFINDTRVDVTHNNGNYGTDALRNIETFTFAGVSYDLAGLQAAANPQTAAPIRIRMAWNGGKDTLWSSAIESKAYSAADMAYNGESGNLISLARTSIETLTINFLQDVSYADMRIDGSDNRDVTTITGVVNGVGTRIYAEGGDDEITIDNGFNGDHLLYGGAGNDILTAQNGRDILHGEAGNDTLNGGGGRDKLYGDEGNDTLNGDGDKDYLYGNAGDDVINGGEGNDLMYGLEDNDTLNGDNGNDRIYGGTGNDIINGGNNNDRLYGENGNDRINGDAGHDKIYGGAGNDTLSGNDGDDTIYAHDDHDLIYGNDGRDKLYGLNGNDRIEGGADRDNIFGGDGNDTMIGGEGNDFLYGEEGADIFAITSMNGSIDRFKDFDTSEGDAINITDILSGFNEAEDSILDFVALKQKSGFTKLAINTDGAGDDWTDVAYIQGMDLSNTTAEDLYLAGSLIVNQSLL